MSFRKDQTFDSRSVLHSCEQLRQELSSLVEAGEQAAAVDSDSWRFRPLLRQAFGEAWERVARGDFAGLHTLLCELIKVGELVRHALPDPGPPLVEAAREVHFAVHALHVAEASVRPARVEVQLGNRRRSVFERKILRVLFDNQGEYLRRAEILDEIRKTLPGPCPEPPRASQILSDLYNQKLLMRIERTAQGNPQTSFFALSQQGLDLCERLGIGPPERLFEPTGREWRRLIEPSRLAAGSWGKGDAERKVAAFYRPRHGVGCSLALAQSAAFLARNLRSRDSSGVLVLDLEREGSSLQEQLGEGDVRHCRGLMGLLEGYFERPEEERRSWLESALVDEAYVGRPMISRLPNLHYLPPHPRDEQGDLSDLYASLLRDLRREIEEQPRRPDGAPQFASRGFLGDLRSALRKRFAKVLIQAPAGLGPASYLASVLLADEQVLFLRPNERREETIQELIGNCAWREGEASSPVMFVFSPLPPGIDINLPRRIDQMLGLEETAGGRRPVYGILRLYYDERIATGEGPLPDSLDQRNGPGELLRDGYQLLAKALDPQSDLDESWWRRAAFSTALHPGAYRERHDAVPAATARPSSSVQSPSWRERLFHSSRQKQRPADPGRPPGSPPVHREPQRSEGLSQTLRMAEIVSQAKAGLEELVKA